MRTATSGMSDMDSMASGGLPAGKNTLLFGGGCTGKTLVGLQLIME